MPESTASTPRSLPSFLDMDRPAVDALIRELDQPGYRAKQIWRNVYRRAAIDFETMTDLPQGLRTALADQVRLCPADLIQQQTSTDGSTTKTLLRLDDGELVETVLMRYDPLGERRARKTVCVSTQAGCAMGCVFCATGAQGFRRQLSVNEILLQVLVQASITRADEVATPETFPLTNVVFMGMGEPLANYEATHEALSRLTDADGFGLSPRRITVSTVGLLPGITRLAEDHPQVNLAISLHAPNDGLRAELVPVRGASVYEIVAAARQHVIKTGRRISFEYVLLAGLNDSTALASDLARLLRGINCHVNLIPTNPSPGVVGERPSPAATERFAKVLTDAGIQATVRVEKGHDILAACGQLRGDRAQREASDLSMPSG
jgi:23S rRNA (adenine2503-C2)-methyltransferase